MIRRMGEFEVFQRTKDSYFSATKLSKQWNSANGTRKDVSDFLRLSNTKELLTAIYSEMDDTGIPVSKDGAFIMTRGKGVNQGTWMHPYLFIDFAMWLNPKFKLQVIKFIHDQLIEFRHGAGDNYRELSSAVQRLDNINYPNMARGLNYIVFGKHDKELRQNATEVQLKELQDLQKNLAFSINTGLINSFEELIEHMRKMWAIKWNGGI